MATSKSPRPSTESSVSKSTLDVAPAQEQVNMSTDASTAGGNDGSIRSKIAKRVSRIFGNKKIGRQETLRPGNSEPSDSRSSRPSPTVAPPAPKDNSSNISRKKVIPAASSKRMTRTQTAAAGNLNADDDETIEPPSKKSKKGRQAALSKDISEEDRAKYRAQSNPVTFTIPRPLSNGPRLPRPIAYHLGVEVVKPVHPEPEPKPLPLSWHRRHNELRAIEMAAEEAAERAAEEALPSFVVGEENDVEQEIAGTGSSFIPEERGDLEEESDQNDLPFDPQDKEKGKNLGESPKEAVEDSPIPDLPAVSTTSLLRVRFVKKKDKGKGKAIDIDTEESDTEELDTEETPEVPHINHRTGSLPQISDDYNGIGEPTWASSSTDFSWLPFLTSDTDDESAKPTFLSGRKIRRSPVPIQINPLARSLRKMPPGQDVIDEGLHDRAAVVTGTPQPEALTLVFKTGKEDPQRPGAMQHLSTVTYKYEKSEVDWNSARFVKGLNKWRSQILLRTLGSKNEPRWKWTHGEMEALCSILESHLTSPEVEGSWAKIDWDLVAASYNDHFEGVTQKAGELYARVSHRADNGNQSTSKPGKTMATDRDAPVRSSDGVRNQIIHFADPRATNLVQAAKGKSKAAGLGSSIPRSSPSREPAWPTLKRRRESNEDSDEDENNERRPNKKTKLFTSAGRRGGILRNEYDPNFNYADDSPPSGDTHGRQFPDHSPFRIARDNEGEATRAIRAMADAQRLLNPDGAQTNIAVGSVSNQSPPINRKRLRASGENDAEDSNEEKTSPRKVKLEKRLPRNSRAPSNKPSHRHLSNASGRASIATMAPVASAPNLKKRARDEDQVESSDEQKLPPQKKAKKDIRLPRMNIQSPNILPAAALEPQVTRRSQNSGPRPSLNGRLNAATKKSKGAAHLPTLDDYLAED